MEYLKQALDYEQQADRLLERGLIADRDELVMRLSAVSYYRLSGYLYPFRLPDSDHFREGTTLNIVWGRYCFDRRLRMLLLDAIERIEVAVRTQLVYHFSHQHGPFGHCNEENLPSLKIADYISWRETLLTETQRSKDAFKKHFTTKYGDSHRNLPIWMAAELMSMGSLLTFYKGCGKDIQSSVSGHFGVVRELLLTQLLSLNAARNICAHHARLWNRVLGYAPGLPQKNKQPEWHLTDNQGKKILVNNRSGILLILCRRFLAQISPTSQWRNRVGQLFSEFPEIPTASMGLPENWREHPLWKQEP